MRPAKGGAGPVNFGIAKRGAMRARCAGLLRRAKADHRAAADQAGPVIRRLGSGYGIGHGIHIMPVHRQHLPAIGFKPAGGIVGYCQVGAAINGNAVIVKQHNQTAKPHMAGHRGGLMADPFHQAAITGNDIGVVVNKAGAEFRGKMPFGHGHAHRIGKPLAKRPGGGFDSRCMAEFRMAGGDRPQLAEIADLRDGHIGMAGQVQQRIDQH